MGFLQVDFHWKVPLGTSERKINQSTEERQAHKIQEIQVKDSCKYTVAVIIMGHRCLGTKPQWFKGWQLSHPAF